MTDYAIYWVLGTAALVVTAYVVARAGSWGYFRTKREHFDYIKREIGESNGKEE